LSRKHQLLRLRLTRRRNLPQHHLPLRERQFVRHRLRYSLLQRGLPLTRARGQPLSVLQRPHLVPLRRVPALLQDLALQADLYQQGIEGLCLRAIEGRCLTRREILGRADRVPVSRCVRSNPARGGSSHRAPERAEHQVGLLSNAADPCRRERALDHVHRVVPACCRHFRRGYRPRRSRGNRSIRESRPSVNVPWWTSGNRRASASCIRHVSAPERDAGVLPQ